MIMLKSAGVVILVGSFILMLVVASLTGSYIGSKLGGEWKCERPVVLP